jgi:HEAT repeat protein
VAVLLDLMGKLGDARAVTLLMRFLDIEVPELRMAAAVAVGWLQAPAAIEKLDQMEGSDPDSGVRAEARAAIEQILHGISEPRASAAPPSLHARAGRHRGAPGELEYRLIHAVPRPARVQPQGRAALGDPRNARTARRDSHGLQRRKTWGS